MKDYFILPSLNQRFFFRSTAQGGVTFRFSFKNMDISTMPNSDDNKENMASSQTHNRSPKHRVNPSSNAPGKSPRFTTLETAADRENQKLGLSPVKMTPLRSPRNVKGNPLESLAIGQRPIMDIDGGKGKKRLLRKPLPLNHYKKSQKIRILQNTSETSLRPNVGSDEHINPAGGGENGGDQYRGDTESGHNSSAYGSVSEWLDNIKGQDFERVSSDCDPFDLEEFEEGQEGRPEDEYQAEELAHQLNSAQAMKHKTDFKTEINSKLPTISDKALKPTLKMRDFQGRFSKLGNEFAPIESDDEEYDSTGSGGNDPTYFPRIRGNHRPGSSGAGSDSSGISETKRGNGYEDPDVKLPRLLMEDSSDENSEKLERQRLRLINIEANAPDTTRSEPPYLPGQYMYMHKGASSHKCPKKQLSLKEMAASFQRKMVHSQSEDYYEGQKIFSEKMTKHQSVIDNNAYDYFARKNKPKPAMFTPGVPGNTSNGSKAIKPKEINPSIPKQCQHINGNVDPALEANFAKLKHNLRRDNSNVSMKSLASKRKRSRSRERPGGLSRSNSMSSITSTNCSVHFSSSRARGESRGAARGESGSNKDSAASRRRRGRSVSKNRTRSSRFDRDYD